MNFKDLIPYVFGPSRYLGNEINTVCKDKTKTELKIALCFPDLYEVGMSHLGLQILYHILNQNEHILAERVFAPDIDLEKLLYKYRVPLSTWESGIPLNECNIVGFSLQHELCYTNILNILTLGGIPIYARQRDGRYPLIIGGGPVVVNPEPISPFIDGFLIGDGEEAILEIVNVYLECRRLKAGKKELLEKLASIAGFYVPFSFHPRYYPDGTIKEIEALTPNYYKVKRRIVKDLNRVPFPTSPIVPYSRPIHDRLSIEVTRGCSYGCRFCQAGFIYRPVRERTPKNIIKLIETALKNTGYEEISLLSLSIGDYQPLRKLLPLLMNRLNVQGVLLSLPSLRVGTITAEMIDQISQGQRRGFTIAPEAATQRMRNRINKKIREEDIFEITKEIVARKWLSLKLYFMIGLPGEVQEDIEAIAQLSHRLKKLAKHKSKITISIATFIPKPHTPFQWEEQISLSESRKKIDFLRKKAQRYGFYLRWHNPEQSLLEGVFARGDRRLHEVVLRAWLKGARFDSWQDRFQFALWQTAFEDTKIDPKFYLEKKGKDTIFPWKKIDIGVSADFLWQEKLKSEQEEITLDCRYDSCQSCGLCDFKKLSPILYKEDIGKVPKELSSNIFSPHKYRFTFTKLDDARFFSHLEVINIFHRAFKMAGLKLVYSNGFHPLPKISFAIALPVGVESLAETMDVEIYGEFDEKILIKKINQHLPSGLSFLLAKKIPLKTPLATPFAQRFVVDFSPVGSPKEKIDDFGKKESFIWQTKHNSKLRQLDLKKIVKKLTLKGQQRIEIVLLLLPSGSIKITEALRAIFDLKKEEVSKLRILKVGDNLDI